ncbi:MAG: tetratricopeptide repeat protein [Gemmatimonadaceae bacterium]
MREQVMATLQAQFVDLRQLLAQPDALAQRESIKADIIGLYRAVEGEIAELAALKEDVKGLVQQWKSLEESGTGSTSAMPPAMQPAAQPVAMPLRSDHLNASTYIEKGWSLLSLGDAVGAEAALRHALELSPNDPNSEALLGWALMLQERYDDALLTFQRVLMREPQNSLARVNVGYICLKKRIFGEAIEHLSKAIRLDNDRKAVLYAHYYLGLLYLEREMFEDSQNFLRKAIVLGPNLIEAHYALGRANWFSGDRDGALIAWRDGARANKFSPWGKRCAELLEHVEGGGEPPRSS